MSWIMKRLHLIFVALVLCGDTNGFPVWNRTPGADWQAGHSHTPWNQNNQLSTSARPSKQLAGRKGSFSSVHHNSAVQTSQHEPSFVHSSGASVPYAQHQGASTVQQPDMLASGPSRFYRFESLDPVTKGTLSQYQSAANTNLGYGSHNSAAALTLPYTQHEGTPTIQQQDTLTSGPSRFYSFESLDPVNKANLVSQYQSAANTNLAYGSHTQSSSGPSMANPVTAGQLAVAQSLGTSYPKLTSGWYPIFQGQMSTALPQVSGFQTQLSYQPSTTARVSSRPQTSGASTLYEGLTSGIRQTIPSSFHSVVPKGQLSEFQVTANQPSSVPSVLAGQPATVLAQSLGDSYPSQISGRYINFQGLSRPSFSQVPVFQTQSSYKPSTANQVLTGQSAFASMAQSSDASNLRASSGYNSQQQSVPSSFQSVGTNQMYGSQAHSAYQPSTSQISTGQSLSISPLSQAPFSSRAESSENAKWYTIMHPHTISASFPSVSASNWISGFQAQSSNQPSSVSQVLASPSTIADSLQASATSQTSGRRTLLQGQASPSQLSGFQTQSSHHPSTTTWLSAGLPASTSQAHSSGASMLNRDLLSGKYLTSAVQSSPSATQPAATLNQAYGTRTSSYQPLTSFLPGRFASIAAAQSERGSQKVLPRSNI